MACKEKGGLDLPNLKLYYWAAQLRAIVAWVTKDEEIGWKSIKQNSLKGISISTIPFLSLQTQKKLKLIINKIVTVAKPRLACGVFRAWLSERSIVP